MNKTRLNASRTRRNRRQAIVIPAANKDQNAKGFRRFAQASQHLSKSDIRVMRRLIDIISTSIS